MASVMLRNHGITVEASATGDRWSEESWENAQKLHGTGVTFDKALVDRFDGLVLIGPKGSWHFEHALCGYEGTGPQTTAKILSLFGFGSQKEIMQRIKDDYAVELYR